MTFLKTAPFGFLLLINSCTRFNQNSHDSGFVRSKGISVVDYSNPSKDLKESCLAHSQYQSLRSTIKIAVVFGYKDTRPSRFVADPFERSSLVNHFTQACALGEESCGFEQDKDNMNLLSKNITLGPRTLKVELRMVHSSYGPDDEENQNAPEQKRQSKIAESEFTRALEQSDALFYIGHSRDGGGPDFHPPRLTKDGHVDYPFYVKSKSGLKKLTQSLAKRSKQQPLLLGVMSCSSSEHFATELLGAFDKLTLITSRVLIYYTDALANTQRAIDQYLKGNCLSDYRKAFRSPYVKSGNPIKIEGFLSESPSDALKKPSNSKNRIK